MILRVIGRELDVAGALFQNRDRQIPSVSGAAAGRQLHQRRSTQAIQMADGAFPARNRRDLQLRDPIGFRQLDQRLEQRDPLRGPSEIERQRSLEVAHGKLRMLELRVGVGPLQPDRRIVTISGQHPVQVSERGVSIMVEPAGEGQVQVPISFFGGIWLRTLRHVVWGEGFFTTARPLSLAQPGHGSRRLQSPAGPCFGRAANLSRVSRDRARRWHQAEDSGIERNRKAISSGKEQKPVDVIAG
jgi:hypothetical protein